MVPVAVATINEISGSAGPVDLTVKHFMDAHTAFALERVAIEQRAQQELSDLTLRHQTLLAPVMQEFFDESCSLRRSSSQLRGNDDQVLVHHFGDRLASHERLFPYKGFLNRLAKESAEYEKVFPVLMSYVSSEGRGTVQSLCMYAPRQSQLTSEVFPVDRSAGVENDNNLSRCRLSLDCRTAHVQGLQGDDSSPMGLFKVREIRSSLVMSEYLEYSKRDIGSPVLESLERLLDSENVSGVAVKPQYWIGWRELDSFVRGVASTNTESVVRSLLQGFCALGVSEFSANETILQERLNSAARHLQEHYRMAQFMDG